MSPTTTAEANAGTAALERIFTNARTFLDAAAVEIPVIAEHLRREDVQPVIERLGQLLQGLGSLARLAVDLRQIGRGGDGGEPIDLGPMTDALRSLVDQQERRNWSAAADVLESRVAPELPRWRAALAAAASRHAGDAGGA